MPFWTWSHRTTRNVSAGRSSARNMADQYDHDYRRVRRLVYRNVGRTSPPTATRCCSGGIASPRRLRGGVLRRKRQNFELPSLRAPHLIQKIGTTTGAGGGLGPESSERPLLSLRFLFFRQSKSSSNTSNISRRSSPWNQPFLFEQPPELVCRCVFRRQDRI